MYKMTPLIKCLLKLIKACMLQAINIFKKAEVPIQAENKIHFSIQFNALASWIIGNL